MADHDHPLQSEQPLNHCGPSDHLNHSYSLRARKAAKNYDMFRARNDDQVVVSVQFSSKEEDGGGSGYCSPPLWKTEPPTTTKLDYQCLSDEAKSQAVARGQRELMEMIKNMPESDYELTLKDIVERHRNLTGEDDDDEEKDCRTTGARHGSRELFRKQQRTINKKPVLRSGSFNNNNRSNNNGGFLLNMGFPFSFGFGRSKKKKNPKATGLVSPKPLTPPVLDGGGGKAVEKEWWKKRLAGSGGDSESVGMSSNNSGSTGSSRSSTSSRSINNREKAGFGSGCWSCFRVKIQKE